MDKKEAIELLGGSSVEAARRVGVSLQAICQWPDQLPKRLTDRVQAALWRQHQEQLAHESAPSGSSEAGERAAA